MRAITVSSCGASPSVTELPTPQAGPGQVLIATQAAGMNPTDVTIANEGWQDLMPATFPMVLGADLAGGVREVGPGAAQFAPGDEGVGQLLIPPLGSKGPTRSTWPAAKTPRWRGYRPAWTRSRPPRCPLSASPRWRLRSRWRRWTSRSC
jgi:Alcohol dehydrogenase GroES-like domain